MKNGSKSVKASNKKARPLAKPPKLPSRKQARKLTTEFHRLTRLRDQAQQQNDTASVARCNQLIDQMGGREEYQKASQTSTSFFSTSKWVLGVLSRKGWLHGIVLHDTQTVSETNNDTQRKKKTRRPTRLMEVGAINTELLNASSSVEQHEQQQPETSGSTTKRYNLQVRALDLHAMEARIEQADFLQIPNPTVLYDVMVCSMVLNCVTTAEQRGEMLSRLSRFVRPGGLVFVTLPRTCLNLSPYMDRELLIRMFKCLHLEVVESKDSPKVAFFVLEKRLPLQQPSSEAKQVPPKWKTVQRIRQGKKFKNPFAIALPSTTLTI